MLVKQLAGYSTHEHSQLYEVECLRGVAALLVLGFHTWGISIGEPDASAPFPLVFFAAGQTGVTLFFVLSGFLLSLPWVRWARNKTHVKQGIQHYYTARAMRILPMYLVWVLLALMVTGEWGNAAKALTFQFI